MHTTQSPSGEKPTARELVERLDRLYRELGPSARQQEQAKRGLARLLDRWFRGAQTADADPMYREFLDAAGALTQALAAALVDLGPAERDERALAAARILLAPKKLETCATDEWYRVAAERECAALLPFLRRDTLKRLRDEYVRNTPRRMMLPRQRELLDQMERLGGARGE